jgi:hypothetical protein
MDGLLIGVKADDYSALWSPLEHSGGMPAPSKRAINVDAVGCEIESVKTFLQHDGYVVDLGFNSCHAVKLPNF